ncbi:hypothetical protein [Phenylobacterium sp.]|uniref:hypothetical protein n=1 Tax=Phenylobacterium sp. TaxID=1871053 RepID=UPI0035B047F5
MLIAALAAVSALAARPADLVPRGAQEAYSNQLAATVLGLAAQRNGAACGPDAKVVSLGQTRLGTAASVMGAKDGDPVRADAGVYKEHLRVEGCGTQPRRDNILVIRQTDGRWVMAPMFWGDTLTTPVQQHDAVQSALQAIQLAPPAPTCEPGEKPFELVDTEVTETTLLKSGIWSERWLIRACGEDRPVEISFMPRPDGKATSVVVKQGWPAEPPPKP